MDMVSDCATYESQRLLRRANEISPEATAMIIQAIEELSHARLVNPSALYYIYQAVPTANKPKGDKDT